MTSSSLRSGNCSDDYQEESGVLETCTIEDRLMDALENITAKSAKTRLVAFESIRKAMSEHYLFDYVYNSKITILDTLNRTIGKRSQGQDLGFAANIIALVCSTLGPDSETDPLFNDLITQLLVHLADQTIQPSVRSKCARSIGVCAYIIAIEGYLEQIMDPLYSVFSASCAKGDSTMPNPDEKIASLHAACLQSWTLLLTAMHSASPHLALDLVEGYMDKITQLLDSPHLEVKCAAGETLAIMFEIIKSHEVELPADDMDDLCDKLREMITDSQKSKGKKDLRVQRSNFREILATIEEDETPSLVIKFHSERLVLSSWARRRQYDAFCELFGTGFNQQLAENEIIRDLFDLGPVLSPLDLPRVKRSDNSYENMLADKIRTKHMRKLRDKRAVLLN